MTFIEAGVEDYIRSHYKYSYAAAAAEGGGIEWFVV